MVFKIKLLSIGSSYDRVVIYSNDPLLLDVQVVSNSS